MIVEPVDVHGVEVFGPPFATGDHMAPGVCRFSPGVQVETVSLRAAVSLMEGATEDAESGIHNRQHTFYRSAALRHAVRVSSADFADLLPPPLAPVRPGPSFFDLSRGYPAHR